MDINQGNRLIMESPFISDHHKQWIEKLIKFEGKPDAAYDNAKYHTSWEWIMPVCKKFDHLPLIDMEYQKHCDNIDHAVTTYEILPVWNALTEAIQWYNNTQTDNNG